MTTNLHTVHALENRDGLIAEQGHKIEGLRRIAAERSKKIEVLSSAGLAVLNCKSDTAIEAARTLLGLICEVAAGRHDDGKDSG